LRTPELLADCVECLEDGGGVEALAIDGDHDPTLAAALEDPADGGLDELDAGGGREACDEDERGRALERGDELTGVAVAGGGDQADHVIRQVYRGARRRGEGLVARGEDEERPNWWPRRAAQRPVPGDPFAR
jgi:hypothetical protein